MVNLLAEYKNKETKHVRFINLLCQAGADVEAQLQRST